MIEEPKLLVLGSMARRANVNARWLRAEALAGRVPHLNADGTLLFNPPALIAALAARAGADQCSAAAPAHDVAGVAPPTLATDPP